jgi:D-citramalate synthase
VPDEQLAGIVERVKTIGDRGKRVTDADLLTIAEEVTGTDRDRTVRLLGLTAVSGATPPTASVRLGVAGEMREEAATGSGPVDAAMNAAESALRTGVDVSLESYRVDATTGGTDAVVTAEVNYLGVKPRGTRLAHL